MLVLLLTGLTLVLALSNRHKDTVEIVPPSSGTAVGTDTPADELALIRGAHRASRSRVLVRPTLSSTPTRSRTVVHRDARPTPRATRTRAFIAKPVQTDFAHSRRGIAIANCESGPGPRHPKYDVYVGDPHQVSGSFYGKWQFSRSTWRSVGGSGSPATASVREQDYRANLLYAKSGEGPWECRLYV